jgi:fibronectin type 3 domain-containing protein
VPAKVTGVTVKRAKKAATIKWKAVPGATSYEVRVGKGKAKSTSATSMKIKKLSPKKKYTVQVVAVNAAGKSSDVTVKVKTFRKK